MKKILVVLALVLAGCDNSANTQPKSNTMQTEMPDRDGCIVKTVSKLSTSHKVGEIYNLVKDKEYFGNRGECTVNFDIDVNGKTYHLEETEVGLEQLESLCYYARERARKNLLLDLGGEFKTDSIVSCRRIDK